MKKEIAVLIPCYNEALTITKVVRDFKRELPSATIYVYDNNSTDGTAMKAKEAGAIVRYEHKQGKGNVIRRMFREIQADCYLMVDGDDTYPASNAAEMVREVLEGGTDMVVGDRLSSTYFSENKRPFHNVGNSMVRHLINKIYNSDIQDVMTGYRAFSPLFVKSFPVLSQGFEIETEMTMHALRHNLSIQNVVIQYQDRPEGSMSKLNTYSDGFKVLSTIVKLLKNDRPLLFFGFFTVLSWFFSGLLMIPVLSEYLSMGIVLKIPSLIVSCILFIFGTLSLFSGLILSSLAKKSIRDFEYHCYLYQTIIKKENEHATI